MRGVLLNSVVSSGSIFFSPNCPVHCISTSPEAHARAVVKTPATSRFKDSRVTLKEVLDAWLNDGWTPPNGKLVATCEGADCGC
mmetsp:Transcript_119856/g.382607  ORF Transcript_119856/g.382607 Transcript_119856/m.382607 type:complete len:84 (+) Transcript_119856:327-578(+)